MEVNATPSSQANPSLRHMGGANILFVDGHVERVVLKAIDKKLLMGSTTPNVTVKSWEGEFVDGGGNVLKIDSDAQIKAMRANSIETLGYRRNPDMPLIWSVPGKFYR